MGIGNGELEIGIGENFLIPIPCNRLTNLKMLAKKIIYSYLFPFSFVPWLLPSVLGVTGAGTAMLFPAVANALPGQTAAEVVNWIKIHPTLRPSSGETLLIRKSDTPAVRFIFEASVLTPGRASAEGNKDIIRTERIELFDMINGVTPNRLQESLRVIYGADIYQDFQRARVVYAYPSEAMVREARSEAAPLGEALRGELRLGDRYAYWLQVAQPREGKAITGHIIVLLKSDLDKLEVELRNR